MASIEDAAECGERADALVSGLLDRVMRQRRSVAAAMDYIGALSRETRADRWEVAPKGRHEGPHPVQAPLSRYKWGRGGAPGPPAGRARGGLADGPGRPTPAG